MRTESTRAEKIRVAKAMRRQRLFQAWKEGLFKPRQPVIGEEVFVDTPHGRVRTLRYGFELPGSRPVYFDMHGGGFMFGRAEKDEAMNLEISEKTGVRIVSIEYAKAPEFPYPVALDQVRAVVEHVRGNADAWGIDERRMAIGGHSAGGNLAAAACIRAKREGRFRFLCQILDYPPLDLATDPYEKPQPEGCIPPHVSTLFDACYVSPEQRKDPCVSPVFATAEQLAGMPPALFILPCMDSLHDEGMKYAGMLREAGVCVECHEYPRALHGFTVRPSADTADAVDKMAIFLKKHLFR